MKRSLRDKCRGGNHVDEDFTFIFNSAANKRTCVGGFSLELIQTTDGQDVHEWLARTPLGTGHCGPFNRPDNLISTGKSAAEAARATGAVKKAGETHGRPFPLKPIFWISQQSSKCCFV